MSYCPKCHHEYADTVERCIDCDLPLRKGQRPVQSDLEFEDLLVPVGSVAFVAISLLMLYVSVGARVGWVHGPIANLAQTWTPPCMIVFYAIAAIASAIVFGIWMVQRLLRRS